VILERFLMCCGGFKNDLLRQNLVNESLEQVSALVKSKLDKERFSKALSLKLLKTELDRAALKIKLSQQLLIAHSKYDDFLVQPQSEEDSLLNHSFRSRRNTIKFEERRTVRARASSLVNKKLTIDEPVVYTFNITDIQTFIEQQTHSSNDATFRNLTYQGIPVQIDRELLYTPFAPKNPLEKFVDADIYLSKKKPLLIVAELADLQRCVKVNDDKPTSTQES
jgi:hypothetical protein